MLLTQDLAQSELKVSGSDECEYSYSRQKSRAGPCNVRGVHSKARASSWERSEMELGTAQRNRKGAGVWRGFHSQT